MSRRHELDERGEHEGCVVGYVLLRMGSRGQQWHLVAPALSGT